VVTGKLDVRELATRLPDEALSDEVGDDISSDEVAESADEEAAA
jgi:hypothetical protein